MLVNFVAQIPPTPTLLPVPTAPLDIPSVGVWGVTDDLLQFWNTSGVATGAQLLIIGGLVIAGIFVFIYFVRHLGGKDDN